MDDRARLKRMRLVARLRGIEHREAAERLHGELSRERRARELAQRTAALGVTYAARDDAMTAHELAAQSVLATRMRVLAVEADAGAGAAAREAEVHRAAEQTARRRRDRARDHADMLARAAADRRFAHVDAPARARGTELEE